MLLEKAFAKLWGSYHALDGGIMDDFEPIDTALQIRDLPDASTTADDEHADLLATLAWSCTGAPKESAAE